MPPKRFGTLRQLQKPLELLHRLPVLAGGDQYKGAGIGSNRAALFHIRFQHLCNNIPFLLQVRPRDNGISVKRNIKPELPARRTL